MIGDEKMELEIEIVLEKVEEIEWLAIGAAVLQRCGVQPGRSGGNQ